MSPSLFVVLRTLDRRKSAAWIHYASAQIYYLRITGVTLHVFILYKPDTTLRWTVGVGPDGVRLRESSLYQ